MSGSLPSLGFTTDVAQVYEAECGISELLDWQVDCLKRCLASDGDNSRSVVFSAPTSAGKTLVAELLMLHRLLSGRSKKCIFIVPFVALGREKLVQFQSVFRHFGLRVEGYMGTLNASGGFDSWDVAVCTIEKANTLLNRLIEEGGLDKIGTIVVDELHIVGDPSRGYLLELVLSKSRFIAAMQNGDALADLLVLRCRVAPDCCRDLQLIGMSATLPNVSLLSEWITGSVLYTSSYRPVPLTEWLKVDDSVFLTTVKGPDLKSRQLSTDFVFEAKNDTDNVIGLCLETVMEGNGVLIFCSSKVACENLAATVAKAFEKMFPQLAVLKPGFKWSIEQQSEFVRLFSRSAGTLDRQLAKTLPYLVAFHHAGLTMEEREAVERGFLSGSIRVVVATSTLSSGVNLPAKRVIIRSIWGQPNTRGASGPCLTPALYNQMAGRAGRKGVDVEGESILICKKSQERRARWLMTCELPPVKSALVDELGTPQPNQRIQKALLEVIASGITKTRGEIMAFLDYTLMAAERKNQCGTSFLPALVDACIEALKGNADNNGKSDACPLVEERDGILTPTRIGSAALGASLGPDQARTVFEDLKTAQSSLSLETDLHLVYLVTPLNICDAWGSGSNFNWNHFCDLFARLTVDERRAAGAIGVSEQFIQLAAVHGVTRRAQRKKEIHMRFYTALALFDLINEVKLEHVAAKFGCNRGQLQSLQQQAASYAGMVVTFCDRLAWRNLRVLLHGFAERLLFGVTQELTQLVRIDGIDGSRARALSAKGFGTLAAVARADPVEGLIAALKTVVPFKQGCTSDKNLWLAGHPEMVESRAIDLILRRARMLLADDLSAIGLSPEDVPCSRERQEVEKSQASPATQSFSNVGNSRSISMSTKNLKQGTACLGSNITVKWTDNNNENTKRQSVDQQRALSESADLSGDLLGGSHSFPDQKHPSGDATFNRASSPPKSGTVSSFVHEFEVKVASYCTVERRHGGANSENEPSTSVPARKPRRLSASRAADDKALKRRSPRLAALRTAAIPGSTKQAPLNLSIIDKPLMPTCCRLNVAQSNCANNNRSEPEPTSLESERQSINEEWQPSPVGRLRSRRAKPKTSTPLHARVFAEPRPSRELQQPVKRKSTSPTESQPRSGSARSSVLCKKPRSIEAMKLEECRDEVVRQTITKASTVKNKPVLPLALDSIFSVADSDSTSEERSCEINLDELKSDLKTTLTTATKTAAETLRTKPVKGDAYWLGSLTKDGVALAPDRCAAQSSENAQFKSDNFAVLCPASASVARPDPPATTNLSRDDDATFIPDSNPELNCNVFEAEDSQLPATSTSAQKTIEDLKKDKEVTLGHMSDKRSLSLSSVVDVCHDEPTQTNTPNQPLPAPYPKNGPVEVGPSGHHHRATSVTKQPSAVYGTSVTAEELEACLDNSCDLIDGNEPKPKIDASLKSCNPDIGRSKDLDKLQFACSVTEEELAMCVDDESFGLGSEKRSTANANAAANEDHKSARDHQVVEKSSMLSKSNLLHRTDSRQHPGPADRGFARRLLTANSDVPTPVQPLLKCPTSPSCSSDTQRIMVADSQPHQFADAGVSDVQEKAIGARAEAETLRLASDRTHMSGPRCGSSGLPNEQKGKNVEVIRPPCVEGSKLKALQSAKLFYQTPCEQDKARAPRLPIDPLSPRRSEPQPKERNLPKPTLLDTDVVPSSPVKVPSSRSPTMRKLTSRFVRMNTDPLPSSRVAADLPDLITGSGSKDDALLRRDAGREGEVSTKLWPNRTRESPTKLKLKTPDNTVVLESPTKQWSPRTLRIFEKSIIGRSRAIADKSPSTSHTFPRTTCTGIWSGARLTAGKNAGKRSLYAADSDGHEKKSKSCEPVAVDHEAGLPPEMARNLKRFSESKNGQRNATIFIEFAVRRVDRGATDQPCVMLDKMKHHVPALVLYNAEASPSFFIIHLKGDSNGSSLTSTFSYLKASGLDVVAKESKLVYKIAFLLGVENVDLVFGCMTTANWLLEGVGVEVFNRTLADPDPSKEIKDLVSKELSTTPVATSHAVGEHTTAHQLLLDTAGLLVQRARVWARMEGQLKNESTLLWDTFRMIETPVTEVIARMEVLGFAFDLAKARAMQTQIALELRTKENEAHDEAGRWFNLGSPKEVAKVLFTDLRLPPDGDPRMANLPRAQLAKRHYKTDKATLNRLTELHKLPRIILAWRSLTEALSSLKLYIRHAEETVRRGTPVDATIPSIVRLTGSFSPLETGRVQMTDPPLQTVPKPILVVAQSLQGREPMRVALRELFVAEEGNVLITADYSQLELRVLAHLASEQRLIHVFQAGGDLFKMVASSINGIPEEDVTPDMRQKAKAICYGILYGRGARSLGEELEISQDDAQNFINSFMSQFPAVNSWIIATKQTTRVKGRVYTIAGRARPLPAINARAADAKAHAERQAVNTAVQGSAADIFKAALRDIQRKLREERTNAKIVHQVHDEVIVETPVDQAAQVAQLVKQSMQTAWPGLRVPLNVCLKRGTSWGDLTDID